MRIYHNLLFSPDASKHGPEVWKMPAQIPPPTYLDFLRWSNGGRFRNGNRHFHCFLPSCRIREVSLIFDLLGDMPGAVPFAEDQGGNIYLFDMRLPPKDGEYPIVFNHAG